MQIKPCKNPAVFCSIMVFGVLTRCALAHSVQRGLIQKTMLYKFELHYKAAEAIKNIWCAKGDGTVGHSTVTKWLKNLCSGCKNLDDHLTLSGSKSVDSEAVLQAKSGEKHLENIKRARHLTIQCCSWPLQKRPLIPDNVYFHALSVSMVMYVYTAYTLTKRIKKMLDCNYHIYRSGRIWHKVNF